CLLHLLAGYKPAPQQKEATPMFVQLTKDFLGHKAGERIELAEGDAAGLISSGTAATVADDVITPLITQALDRALGGVTGQIQSAVDAALKEFSNAQTLSRKNQVPRIFGEGNPGDTQKSFGRFLLAIQQKNPRVLEEMGSRFVEWDNVSQKTAMSTQTGTSGGYLVPAEFYSELMQLVSEKSLVRPRATVIPMSSR